MMPWPGTPSWYYDEPLHLDEPDPQPEGQFFECPQCGVGEVYFTGAHDDPRACDDCRMFGAPPTPLEIDP